jgi:hypothetical protein
VFTGGAFFLWMEHPEWRPMLKVGILDVLVWY